MKLNSEGYPLYPIMCQGNGKGRPVAYLFVKDESKESLTHAFHIFAKYNQNVLNQTQVLMEDKDFNEINCLNTIFTKAKVLLCTFHVIKYIKGKGKEWYHECCRKIPKKYFTNEALDYFCQKYVI